MALTLYLDRFWISPYAFSAFVALEEKGVPFQVKELGLDKKDHHDPAYRKGSLTGRIPSLEHDGFWLSESSAIDEYLEDTFPPPKHPRLYPAGTKDRARARQLQAWIRSDLMPIREERGTHTMFYKKAEKPLSKEGQEAAKRLLEVAGALLPEGKDQLFESWSIADADLAFMLMRLVMNGEAVPPRVKAFAETQWKRPSVKKFAERSRPPYVPY